MLWNTAAELHAALNDLPVVLLLLALVFDILGGALKRESLRAAGFWTLVAGAGGAVLALVSGLRAEDSIEHGGSVHLVLERHETLAIVTTVLFGGLALWRIIRYRGMTKNERPAYWVVGALGALFLIWTSHVGGTIVYRHGGGIPTSVMEGALQERSTGHAHASGEEHEHPASSGDSTAPAGMTPDSIAPPDTAAHQHDQ